MQEQSFQSLRSVTSSPQLASQCLVPSPNKMTPSRTRDIRQRHKLQETLSNVAFLEGGQIFLILAQTTGKTRAHLIFFDCFTRPARVFYSWVARDVIIFLNPELKSHHSCYLHQAWKGVNLYLLTFFQLNNMHVWSKNRHIINSRVMVVSDIKMKFVCRKIHNYLGGF